MKKIVYLSNTGTMEIEFADGMEDVLIDGVSFIPRPQAPDLVGYVAEKYSDVLEPRIKKLSEDVLIIEYYDEDDALRRNMEIRGDIITKEDKTSRLQELSKESQILMEECEFGGYFPEYLLSKFGDPDSKTKTHWEYRNHDEGQNFRYKVATPDIRVYAKNVLKLNVAR